MEFHDGKTQELFKKKILFFIWIKEFQTKIWNDESNPNFFFKTNKILKINKITKTWVSWTIWSKTHLNEKFDWNHILKEKTFPYNFYKSWFNVYGISPQPYSVAPEFSLFFSQILSRFPTSCVDCRVKITAT